MELRGTITQDGSWWVVDVPALGGPITQARTVTGARRMAAAWVRDMLDRQDLEVEVRPCPGDAFRLRCGDAAALIALVLRRRREASGMSTRQVADRMGSRSPNAYARYERGDSVPSIDQLDRLLHAVGGELILA